MPFLAICNKIDDQILPVDSRNKQRTTLSAKVSTAKFQAPCIKPNNTLVTTIAAHTGTNFFNLPYR